jgi:thiol-disulfide isomerase/thioredoxin
MEYTQARKNMTSSEGCCVIFCIVILVALIIAVACTCTQYQSPQCFVDCFNASNETIKHKIKGGKHFDFMNHTDDISKKLKVIHESGKPGLIALLADWCGYCKQLKSSNVLDDIAKTFHVIGMNDKHPQSNYMMKGVQAQGYPTLIIFYKGSMKKYEGPRTAQAIMDAMRKME